MPDFEITSPDGKTFTVSTPEGVTREQVMARFSTPFEAAQGARESQARPLVRSGPPQPGGPFDLMPGPDGRLQVIPGLQPADAPHFFASLKSALVEDEETKRRLIAQELFPGDPKAIDRVGFLEGVPAYVDDNGVMRKLSPGMVRFGAEAMAALPETIGATAGSVGGGVPGATLGAVGMRGIKRAAAGLIFDEPQTIQGNLVDLAGEGALNVAAGLAGRGVSKFADRGRVVDFTPRAMRTADQVRQYVKRSMGIDLDLAQASGDRKLIALRAYAARYPGRSADLIQAADEAAMGQFDAATNRVLDSIATAKPFEVAGADAVNTAQMAIKLARQSVYTKVAPLYEAAYAAKPQINNPRLLSMLKLPYFDRAFQAGQRIAKLEGKALQPGDKPDLRALDYTKQGLDDQIEKLQMAGRRKEAAALLQRKNEFVAFLDNITDDKYQVARREYQKLIQQTVEPLENGPLGVLAKIDNRDAAIAAARIFDDRGLTPAQIQTMRSAIEKQNPDTWNSLVRTWMSGKIDRALRETQTGEVINPAGKVRQTFFGRESERQQVRAMLPAGASSLFEDLMFAAEKLSSTPIAGSNTMRDTEIKEMLGSTGAVVFRWLTSPRAAVVQTAERRALEQGTASITEALLDPGKRGQLRQVVRMAPSTKQAILITSIVTGQAIPAAVANASESPPPALQQ